MKISSIDYEVKDTEWFYNLEIIPILPSVIRSNIPKLMPKIPKGTPSTSVVGLSKSIYCNDPACKPSVGSTIGTQNFITLRKHPHQQPDFSIDGDICANTKITPLHRFTVNIMHGDIRHMHISTK